MNISFDPNNNRDVNDPNVTADLPISSPADSLDAGMAAGFGKRTESPRSIFATCEMRPVLLKEADGESSAILRTKSDSIPAKVDSGDRYQLSGEIARGGMGAVLRGRDVDLGRDLAVKVLLEKYANRPEVSRRFVEEAQIGSQLQHPGIVPVYDIGRFGDRPFFTMKLVKGATLAAILGERTDPFADWTRLLGIALQISQTLAYAHAKGVIHRDLKPANIMVGAFGEVQVMDWGLAKVLAEGGVADEARASRIHQPEDATMIRTARSTGTAGGSHGTETEMGSLLGTPAYMPPEQANGDTLHLDRRSDVFGLGAILCEIVTGKPPYLGRSGEEVRRKAAIGDLADATARLDACGGDTELIAVIKQCLEPEAIDRPKDAQGVADGLSAYINGVQERSHTAERELAVAVGREAEQRKKRTVQLALAGMVGLLMLCGGAFALWQMEQAQAGRERNARNAEAVSALLGQCEESLRAEDASKAALSMDAAKKRSQDGGAENLADQLKRLDADLTLLRDFDAIDRSRWGASGVEQKAAKLKAQECEALRRFGINPDAISLDDASIQISVSTIRDRIVLSLDRLLAPDRIWDWERLMSQHPTKFTPQLREDLEAYAPKAAGVLALLKRVDADPFRDTVRDAIVAVDQARFLQLVSQDEALQQPATFAEYLGEQKEIGRERRRELLRAAVIRRPGKLELLIALGWITNGDNGEAAKADRLRWFQASVAAAPYNAWAQYSLGLAHHQVGNDDEAIACYTKSHELDPNFMPPIRNLAYYSAENGQFDEAISGLKKALELEPNETNLQNSLTKVERTAAAQVNFANFQSGSFTPASNEERLGMADWCRVKKLWHAAAGLSADAFANDPKLADELNSHRYNAACFATLAAAGQGEDASELEDKERTRLRRLAYDWLRAELAAHNSQLENGTPADQTRARQMMEHWQRDTDLASIRDAEALAKLPESQQKAFNQLWSDVAELLKKAGSQPK